MFFVLFRRMTTSFPGWLCCMWWVLAVSLSAICCQRLLTRYSFHLSREEGEENLRQKSFLSSSASGFRLSMCRLSCACTHSSCLWQCAYVHLVVISSVRHAQVVLIKLFQVNRDSTGSCGKNMRGQMRLTRDPAEC